jgi:hypothetical protein
MNKKNQRIIKSNNHKTIIGDAINMKTTTKKSVLSAMIILAAILYVPLSSAGPLNPDCTAEKAAKSAAAKATVGVGGRCSPAEAAKDTAKKATGIEGKVPSGKSADLTKGAVKAVVK